jgi:hypothetical protein
MYFFSEKNFKKKFSLYSEKANDKMFKPSDLKLFLAFELLGNAAKSFAFGESRPPQELFLKNFFRHSSLLNF